MIAVDTNILIYAHRGEMAEHPAALKALRRLAESGEAWALPVFVLAEFLRVATHAQVLEPPSDERQAIAVVEALMASPGVRVLTPGDQYWGLLRETVLEAGARGNAVHDAAIAALCREWGANEILTHDRDFERFSGVRVRRLPG